MGFFDSLGDMARSKYDSFKEDPYGSVSRTVSSSIDRMNSSYEKKKEDVIRTGSRKARELSDDQLYAYSSRMDREGNSIGQEVARREMERRGV